MLLTTAGAALGLELLYILGLSALVVLRPRLPPRAVAAHAAHAVHAAHAHTNGLA